MKTVPITLLCAASVHIKLTVFWFWKVGLLNVDGYYNTFLSFIDKAVEEGFISPTARHIIVSAPTPKELVKEMEVIVTSFFQ